MSSYCCAALVSPVRLAGKMEPAARKMCPSRTSLATVLLYLVACASFATAQRLVSPTRIAEGAPGQLLVSDYAAEAIFVADKQTLQTLWAIPIKGKPMGVARLGSLMFVGNERTQSVEVYAVDDARRKVRLRYTLGPSLSNTGPGFFRRPTDIAIDPEFGLVFVLDGGDQLIKVFDTTGIFIRTFPPAVTNQTVSFVAGIGVDTVQKEILVTDHGNPGAGLAARILVFTYDGTYRRQINGNGYVDGSGTQSTLQFARPQGVAADGAGHLFMVDPVLGKMIAFDENNILDADNVGVVKRLDGFASATDLVIDGATGDIFAVNHKTATVLVFRGEGRI